MTLTVFWYWIWFRIFRQKWGWLGLYDTLALHLLKTLGCLIVAWSRTWQLRQISRLESLLIWAKVKISVTCWPFYANLNGVLSWSWRSLDHLQSGWSFRSERWRHSWHSIQLYEVLVWAWAQLINGRFLLIESWPYRTKMVLAMWWLLCEWRVWVWA